MNVCVILAKLPTCTLWNGSVLARLKNIDHQVSTKAIPLAYYYNYSEHSQCNLKSRSTPTSGLWHILCTPELADVQLSDFSFIIIICWRLCVTRCPTYIMQTQPEQKTHSSKVSVTCVHVNCTGDSNLAACLLNQSLSIIWVLLIMCNYCAVSVLYYRPVDAKLIHFINKLG